jgi:hypothetical protein
MVASAKPSWVFPPIEEKKIIIFFDPFCKASFIAFSNLLPKFCSIIPAKTM